MNDNKDKKIKKTKKVKESIEKAIIKNMPLDEIQWISQPLSITMMRADLSPMQISLVVEMVDKFQDKIMDQIKKSEEERLKTPSLFTEEEIQQERYIARFPLKDLDVRADAYEELHKAAVALQAMQIQMPVVKQGGAVSLDIFSLFSRISIPMLEGYEYKSGKRRAGYIEMTMDKDAFNDVMRVGKQYTKYIKSVTRNRKCKYTSRIYMFISTYKVFGKWTIPFVEFHKMLGFSYEDEKLKETIILNYKQFSDMKRSVLDPSQKELKKMAEEGSVDCYFDYEPIFPRGKTKGFPDKICFSIYSSNIGKEISADNKTISENIQIETFLKKELKQTPTNCQNLMKLLTEENRVGFQQKMKSLKTYCDDPAHKVENTRSYAWQSLIDYMKAHQPIAEEIPTTTKEDKGSKESVGDLSGTNASAPTAQTPLQEPVKPILPEAPQPSLSEENMKKWNSFLEHISKEMPDHTFNTWIKPCVPLSFTERELTIWVQSSFFYEYIEETLIEPFKKAIYAAFGEGTKIRYSVATIIKTK